MANTFYPLQVSSVTKETEDTLTIGFDIPVDLQKTFTFKPGQYLTLKVNAKGTDQLRSYSISSKPNEFPICVTVKRVEKGLVSNLLNDTAKVGDKIEVMAPQGRFVLLPDVDARKTYYMVAGGSGITPIMSMVKTVLEEEPQSNINLFYANRNKDSIIFHSILENLQSKYAGQLKVVNVLSRPVKKKEKGLRGFFKSAISEWDGLEGRIDAKKLDLLFDESPAIHTEIECYMCGPSGLMNTTKTYLKNKGIDSSKIHTELFVIDEPKKQSSNSVGNGLTELVVTIDGETKTTTMSQKDLVLDHLLKDGQNPPYSCYSGVCTSCIAKVTEGTTTMDNAIALDESEIAEGFVLTCQCRPTSDKVVINFDA